MAVMAPVMAKNVAIDFARSRALEAAMRIPTAAGNMSAAPSPCTTRAATIHDCAKAAGVAPHSALPAENKAIPASMIRL